MKKEGKNNMFSRTRRENPTQYKVFLLVLLAYYLLETANYLLHAFLYYFKDHVYYRNLVDLPLFNEVDWMLEQPFLSSYANAYAEYMVWSIGLYVILCLASLVALFNQFAIPPRPSRSASKTILVFGLCVVLIGVFTILKTDHFDGRGFSAGFHPSIPLLFMTLARACAFTLIMIAATPAFVKKAKNIAIN